MTWPLLNFTIQVEECFLYFITHGHTLPSRGDNNNRCSLWLDNDHHKATTHRSLRAQTIIWSSSPFLMRTNSYHHLCKCEHTCVRRERCVIKRLHLQCWHLTLPISITTPEILTLIIIQFLSLVIATPSPFSHPSHHPLSLITNSTPNVDSSTLHTRKPFFNILIIIENTPIPTTHPYPFPFPQLSRHNHHYYSTQ